MNASVLQQLLKALFNKKTARLTLIQLFCFRTPYVYTRTCIKISRMVRSEWKSTERKDLLSEEK